jgi:hypothetical protein
MPLRHFTPREYLANTFGARRETRVYGRAEWASRDAHYAEALVRARRIAVHGATHVLLYRDLYREGPRIQVFESGPHLHDGMGRALSPGDGDDGPDDRAQHGDREEAQRAAR